MTFAGYTDAQLQQLEDEASYEDLQAAWKETFGAYAPYALNPEARARFQRELCLKQIRRETMVREGLARAAAFVDAEVAKVVAELDAAAPLTLAAE